MTARAVSGLNNRFTYASVGLLVAGTTVAALTGSTSAHTETRSAGRPVKGTLTDSPVNVHAATEKALQAVARDAKMTTPATVAADDDQVQRTYRVRPGDTLSEISKALLGDANRYPEIFDLNKGKLQPGGGRLTDPNLIEPGLVLKIPTDRQATPVIDDAVATDTVKAPVVETAMVMTAAVEAPAGNVSHPNPTADTVHRKQSTVVAHIHDAPPSTHIGKATHTAKAKPALVRHSATPAKTSGASMWAKPITTSYWISEAYGVANSRYAAGHHTGIDLAVPSGTPVHAVTNGVVVFAGWGGSYGNLIKIRDSDGRYSLYAHLSRFDVSVGEHVDAAHLIALSGASGDVTGPHLHFEVDTTTRYGSDINPVAYLAAHGIHL